MSAIYFNFIRILCLAHICCLNLLANGETYIQLLPKGNAGEAVNISLSASNMSPVIAQNIKDLGLASIKAQGIPLLNVDKNTLESIVAMMEIISRHYYEVFSYKSIKNIITTSFFGDRMPTLQDILKLLIAADYLHVNSLLKPIASYFVERFNKKFKSYPGSQTEWDQRLQKLYEELNKKEDLPKELYKLFSEYIKYLRDDKFHSTHMILPVDVKILFQSLIECMLRDKKISTF